MGADYNFFCKTCKVYLVMGKVCNVDAGGGEIPWETTGVYSKETGRWYRQDANEARVLEKFLILHRNHDLTFAPENFEDVLCAALGGTVASVSADQVLAAPVVDLDNVVELAVWIKRYGLQAQLADSWEEGVRRSKQTGIPIGNE